MLNRLELVESFLAIQRLGACAVPVNFRLVADEVDYVLRHSRAVGVVADQDVPEAPGLRFTLRTGEPYEAALAEAPADPPGVVVDDEDLAFLMYTSGTTGRPKGAMLTHQNLVVNTTNWIVEMGATADDVWLSGLPLFHIGGINGVLPFLYLGAPSVITASTGFDAAHVIALLAEHAVTMCYFVPTQWQAICTRPEVRGLDASRLRVALWGASTAPRATLELLSRTFRGVQIVNAFGQTEMSSNTAFLKGDDAVRKMGSIGRVAINVEARVVDEQGRDVARGEVGEIVYRGPTVMRGYFDDEAASEEAFRWMARGSV